MSEEGLIEHNAHVMEARAILFARYAYDHRMSVYGEISQPLRDLFSKHAGGVSSYSFLQGLETAAAVQATTEASMTVMAETAVLERLTASDLFLLQWDDFGRSSDIGGLAILDGTRLLDDDGRVRVDAVRRQLEPRLHLVPRFRQLLYRPRRGLGWPLWVDAPSFHLADDVRVHALAAPGDEAQLLQACQQLARRRLVVPLPLGEPDPVLDARRRRASYAGQLNLTAAADQDSCLDVEVFTEGVRRALDDLARSALVSATTDRDDQQRLLEQSVGRAAVGGDRRWVR